VDVDVDASASGGVTIDPISASSTLSALKTDVTAKVVETFTAECEDPGFQEFGFANTIAPINADDPDQNNNEAELTVEIECLIPVQINIEPGGYPNSINLNGKEGVVSLSVLTTAQGEYALPIAIDATKIDPLSVHFGPSDLLLGIDPSGGATESHNTGHILKSVEMNEKTKDGDNDMVLHFDAKKTGLELGDTEGCVKGQIAIGEAWYTFLGCDTVRVVNK
jgi:hypothetical protein